MGTIFNRTNYMLSDGLVKVLTEIEKNGDSEKCHDEEIEDRDEDDEQEQEARRNEEDDGSTIQLRAKRQRRMRCSKKACCAKGCKKTHFWSKKWKNCTKCNKNFCPTHAFLLQHHKC